MTSLIKSTLAALIISGPTYSWGLPAGQANLLNVQYRGSGCPQGSVRFILSADATSFTVLYDAFKLQAGGAIPTGPARMVMRDCDITAEIAKPQDMTFSVENADFRGFVQLDAGVEGVQRVMAIAAKHLGREGRRSDFGIIRWTGPFAQEVIVSVPPQTRQGSENCGRADRTQLVLSSTIRIKGADATHTGMIAVDSVDGAVVQKYMLNWRSCNPGGGGGHGPGGGGPGGGGGLGPGSGGPGGGGGHGPRDGEPGEGGHGPRGGRPWR